MVSESGGARGTRSLDLWKEIVKNTHTKVEKKRSFMSRNFFLKCLVIIMLHN